MKSCNAAFCGRIEKSPWYGNFPRCREFRDGVAPGIRHPASSPIGHHPPIKSEVPGDLHRTTQFVDQLCMHVGQIATVRGCRQGPCYVASENMGKCLGFPMPRFPRPEELRLTIAERLSATRKALDLTQQRLADMLGVGRTTVDNWEQGVRLPDMPAMLRFESRLGIPVEWILVGVMLRLSADLLPKILLQLKKPAA